MRVVHVSIKLEGNVVLDLGIDEFVWILVGVADDQTRFHVHDDVGQNTSGMFRQLRRWAEAEFREDVVAFEDIPQ